ncbi:MAG TPA: hypothetical protein DCE14_01185 [Kosmotogaceae bacterium]|nr:MAG: Uncharacterized protein XE05_0917 [Thermotogales bacterium 46_20]HAA84951.1 hypothetical protein [Kosmotogaceae bacterium]
MKTVLVLVLGAVLMILVVMNTLLLMELRSRLESLERESSISFTRMSALEARVGSLQWDLSEMKEMMTEPSRLLRSQDYRLESINLESAVVRINLTFAQVETPYMELLLKDRDTGLIRLLELRQEQGVYTAVANLVPTSDYAYQVLMNVNGIEKYSEEYVIPADVFQVQRYHFSAQIFSTTDAQLHYSFRFMVQAVIKHDERSITGARVKVFKEGEEISNLEYPFDGPMNFREGTVNYRIPKEDQSLYKFFLEVDYGLGETKTEEIIVD